MGAIDYIDTVGTAAAILRDWQEQHDKLEQLPGKIAELHERRRGVDSQKKAAAIRGFEKAWEYVQDITPAWEHLTDDERFCLTAHYIDEGRAEGIRRIMEHFHVERTQAYSMSNAALKRFATLLFW